MVFWQSVVAVEQIAEMPVACSQYLHISVIVFHVSAVDAGRSLISPTKIRVFSEILKT